MGYPIQSKIETLIAEGRWKNAIKRLEKFSVRTQHPEAITDLRDLRVFAFQHINNKQNESEKSPIKQCADPFPELKNDIPEIDASKLDIETFAGAFNHHGALIVRNLLPSPVVDDLVDGIERTFQAVGDTKGGKLTPKVGDPWFAMMPKDQGQHDRHDKHGVYMMHQTGSFWTLFSPIMTQKLISIFGELELKSLLHEYFGSEPCLSFNKWVLRKVKPLDNPADWHQDGSFMGKGIKSVNLWIALTECGEGTNSPGMDLVPRRLDKVMESGTNGAFFDWSVSAKSVMEWFKDSPPVRPHFNAGDAIFFDHFNLHATSYSKDFVNPRYAVETWFFALDSYADNQSPIVW